ncbi:MAG: hypothetical protein ACK4IX_14770 [Candidatus Sericytochromatia bacterium]
MIGVYINSKIIYVHNNILSLKNKIADEELLLTEQYGNVIDIEDFKIEKSKSNIEFDDEFKLWLNTIVEDFKISNKKEFVVLLLFIKEKIYPLKKDKWLIEKFNLIFNTEIKPQYVSHIRGTELEIIKTEADFTRTQREFYVLFDKINSHFIENYNKK